MSKNSICPFFGKENSSSGQIILAVLLVMAVILTVGLAALSRSVTDIRISKETEESARAFSAAEAGIEEALNQDLSVWSGGDVTVGDLTASVTVDTKNTFQTRIERNETAEVNLLDYEGDVTVSWSGEGLELTLFYPSGSTYKLTRWALKPMGSGCGQDFEELSSPTKTITVPSGSGKKALRVRPICSAAEVTVDAAGLPVQSYLIRSSTTIEEGGQTRVVEVSKSNPVLPPVFDYVLFSGGDLSK
jgi:type II secretory pathway pseudopilin PulG